ncbi:MAG: HAMP domain-containing sensor histidine kinase [Byssovorax sp.]
MSPPSRKVGGATTDSLAEAHARFARTTLLIFFGASAVAVSLLFASLLTDKDHEEEQVREHLLLETEVRAHSLGQHLGLLVEELRRLGLRSEVNMLDQDLSPEKNLLQLAHEKSTFFNLGVAILGARGEVLWSEPSDFTGGARTYGNEPWFSAMRETRELRVVPIHPNAPDAVIFVISPLLHNGELTGALLGGLDLARTEPFAARQPNEALIVLATHKGDVVFPAKPPPFATEPAWRALFQAPAFEPSTSTIAVSAGPTVVTGTPVPGTDLVMLSVKGASELYAGARSRLATRLTLAVLLTASPLLLFVVLLRRSLGVFRRSEADAVREERLRHLGEAANSIAHEVKNALNGLSMGLDLVVRRDGRPQENERRERVIGELRKEIQRLSDFTTELMTFSKGIEPRRTRLDLTEFLPKVTGLLRDSAHELGVEVELVVPDAKVIVDADPTLLHVVISNLTGNALDALTGKGSPADPRVELVLSAKGAQAEIRVSDNGPGVSASMIPRLFEPFQTEKASGVGIGLALAKKIAHAHGGDLVLEGHATERSPRVAGDPSQATPLPASPTNGTPLPRPAPASAGATFVLTLPLEET